MIHNISIDDVKKLFIQGDMNIICNMKFVCAIPKKKIQHSFGNKKSMLLALVFIHVEF